MKTIEWLKPYTGLKKNMEGSSGDPLQETQVEDKALIPEDFFQCFSGPGPVGENGSGRHVEGGANLFCTHALQVAHAEHGPLFFRQVVYLAVNGIHQFGLDDAGQKFRRLAEQVVGKICLKLLTGVGRLNIIETCILDSDIKEGFDITRSFEIFPALPEFDKSIGYDLFSAFPLLHYLLGKVEKGDFVLMHNPHECSILAFAERADQYGRIIHHKPKVSGYSLQFNRPATGKRKEKVLLMYGNQRKLNTFTE